MEAQEWLFHTGLLGAVITNSTQAAVVTMPINSNSDMRLAS